MKQSTIKAYVKSISLFPTDDSSNLNFTAQGRKWSDDCWKFEDNLKKAKRNHRIATMDWNHLKEDSKGDESTARQLQSKASYIQSLEEQISNTTDLLDAVKQGYEKFFDKPYVPYVKTSNSLSSQEVDNDWTPKKY